MTQLRVELLCWGKWTGLHLRGVLWGEKKTGQSQTACLPGPYGHQLWVFEDLLLFLSPCVRDMWKWAHPMWAGDG